MNRSINLKTPYVTASVAIGVIAMCGLLSAAVAADTNTYSNPTLGFSVTKPAHWRFITTEQNAENLSRTRFKDEELTKAVQKYATSPLVAIMKHPEPYDDLNPSFKVNIKPLGNNDGSKPTAILELVSAPLKKLFKDYKVVEPPKETEVGGLKAAYMKIHYTLQTQEGLSFPTCSELWIVPRGKFFFMIGVGSKQSADAADQTELKQILDSIKIVP